MTLHQTKGWTLDGMRQYRHRLEKTQIVLQQAARYALALFLTQEVDPKCTNQSDTSILFSCHCRGQT